MFMATAYSPVPRIGICEQINNVFGISFAIPLPLPVIHCVCVCADVLRLFEFGVDFVRVSVIRLADGNMHCILEAFYAYVQCEHHN